jgi:hypothetical protein
MIIYYLVVILLFLMYFFNAKSEVLNALIPFYLLYNKFKNLD